MAVPFKSFGGAFDDRPFICNSAGRNGDVLILEFWSFDGDAAVAVL